MKCEGKASEGVRLLFFCHGSCVLFSLSCRAFLWCCLPLRGPVPAAMRVRAVGGGKRASRGARKTRLAHAANNLDSAPRFPLYSQDCVGKEERLRALEETMVTAVSQVGCGLCVG